MKAMNYFFGIKSQNVTGETASQTLKTAGRCEVLDDKKSVDSFLMEGYSLVSFSPWVSTMTCIFLVKPRCNYLPIFFLVLFTLAGSVTIGHSLPTDTSSLFSGSGNCVLCHDSNDTALLDAQGNSVSMIRDWSGTMMGQAFRDPFYRAKMRSEIERNPQLQSVIENKCLLCHTPMAHTQAHWDGAENYTLAQAETSGLANDGVSCTLCHQILNQDLGTTTSFSGNFQIDDRHVIFGPYNNMFGQPMINVTDYEPLLGEQVNESALCATCHTLFTPYLNNEGEVAGVFPEQTPYLEWLNSEYKVGGTRESSCQNCHMPPINDGVIISSLPRNGLSPQTPFWRHHFVGGNTLIPAMIRDNAAELGTDVDADIFNTVIERARASLQASASLSAEAIVGANTLEVSVTIENHTGHKFPTGYPSRRAWLHVTIKDRNEQALFESGAWDEDFEIVGLDEGYEPHHQEITTSSQAQVYQTIMGDVDGAVTYTLLRGSRYLKDNRLLPHGFQSGIALAEHTGVQGAAIADPDFNKQGIQEGTGKDSITYRIALADPGQAVSAEIELVYQVLPSRFANDLFQDNGTEIAAFKSMYDAADRKPERIQHLIIDLTAVQSTTDLWHLF